MRDVDLNLGGFSGVPKVTFLDAFLEMNFVFLRVW